MNSDDKNQLSEEEEREWTGLFKRIESIRNQNPPIDKNMSASSFYSKKYHRGEEDSGIFYRAYSKMLLNSWGYKGVDIYNLPPDLNIKLINHYARLDFRHIVDWFFGFLSCNGPEAFKELAES